MIKKRHDPALPGREANSKNLQSKNDFWLDFGIHGAVGFQLALTVVAGWLIGDYFDGKWQTGPCLALAGLAAGFVGGLYNLFRILRWRQKRK